MASDAQKRDPLSVEALAARLKAGDRRALARAITLAESARADHRRDARALLKAVRGATGGALRLALTGAPGAGKSTFIEALGLLLAEAGERLVVLAVDPSSRVSGGAILGDKTRMEKLARHANAYIRPSPAAGALGGAARRTRDCVHLAEAYGASVVILETVGVGQSEIAAKDLSDVFVLMIQPAAGDELQGVKRGVMEMADLVVVTKADGDMAAQAARTAGDYASALRLMRKRPSDPANIPATMTVSAAAGQGLEPLWERIRALSLWRREHGWRDRLRAEQEAKALETEIARGLETAFQRSNAAQSALPALQDAMQRGEITPDEAAERAVALFLGSAK